MFQQAIGLDPKFAMAYARLGTAYFNSEQTKRATENLQKAKRLSRKLVAPLAAILVMRRPYLPWTPYLSSAGNPRYGRSRAIKIPPGPRGEGCNIGKSGEPVIPTTIAEPSRSGSTWLMVS